MRISDVLEKEDNFIRLYKFTCSLPKEQSYMLSYLIDAERFVENGWSKDTDYFECCNNGFISRLLTGWSSKEIDTALKGLQNEGYINIHIERVNGTPHTFIKLNIANIQKLNSLYKKGELAYIQKLNSLYKKGELAYEQKVDRPISKRCINQEQVLITNNKETISKDIVKEQSSSLKDTSKGYISLMNYINELSYPEDVKDMLRKWYESNAKGKVSVGQLKDKLKKIYELYPNDFNKIKQSIENSYLNGWMGFFELKGSYVKQKPKVNCVVPDNKPKEYKQLSYEELNQLSDKFERELRIKEAEEKYKKGE